jgi:hypothetical protein
MNSHTSYMYNFTYTKPVTYPTYNDLTQFFLLLWLGAIVSKRVDHFLH